MAKTILGAFPNQQRADEAWRSLSRVGYDAQDISVLVREGVVIQPDSNTPAENAADGAVSGAVTGGAIAGIAGLLIGLGVIAIPGIGGLLIGGPLAAALGLTGAAATATSAAATGAVAGGLIGALSGLGVPEDRATLLAEHLQAGGVILAVNITNDQEEATVTDVFTANGVTDITSVINR